MADVAGGNRVRVLLVDDTTEYRTVLRVCLELDGRFVVVAEAGDGQQAVELAQAHKPDVAVIDVAMPVMDGLDAIPLIRAASPTTRLVILSAFSPEHMRARTEALGADAYLQKLTAAEDVIAAIAGLVGVARPRSASSGSTRDVDRLIDHLTHEMRAPISVMQGFSSTLRVALDAGDEDSARLSLEAVERNIRVLSGLVSSLLDARAVDMGRLELDLAVVDVASLAENALEDAGVILSHEIRLDLQPGALVHGDSVRLRQVVTNLVNNADKFTPGDSPTNVTVRRNRAGAIELWVRDFGPGIPAPERPKLFKRFARLDRDVFSPGSGLGLYLSRAIARAHGGELDCIDPDDGLGGACFVMRLPALSQPN